VGEFDELIEEFVAESKEHIADIEDDLIKIESEMADVDPEVINRVFRAAHSIKGSARFLDLGNIGELAHRMEDVLNLIRSGKLTPDSSVATALLMSADMLKTMLDDVTASNDIDISAPLEGLRQILDRNSPSARSETASPRSAAPGSPLDGFGVDTGRIREKLASSQVYIITCDASDADLDHFKAELENLGEVIARKEQGGKLITLFSTIMEPDMIPLALGVPVENFVQVDPSMLGDRHGKSAGPSEEGGRPLSDKRKETAPCASSAAKAREKRPQARREIAGAGPDSTMDPGPAETTDSPGGANRSSGELEHTSFITFSLDREIYAVPIQTIEEIIGLQEISLLPNVPGFIRGVINLRGEIVPIMDLRLKFGLDPKEYTPFTVFLIVRVDDRIMGLIVDNVADVLVIDPSKVQRKPAFSARISTEFIKGVYKDDQENLVILMDVPSLIRPEEWEGTSLQAA